MPNVLPFIGGNTVLALPIAAALSIALASDPAAMPPIDFDPVPHAPNTARAEYQREERRAIGAVFYDQAGEILARLTREDLDALRAEPHQPDAGYSVVIDHYPDGGVRERRVLDPNGIPFLSEWFTPESEPLAYTRYAANPLREGHAYQIDDQGRISSITHVQGTNRHGPSLVFEPPVAPTTIERKDTIHLTHAWAAELNRYDPPSVHGDPIPDRPGYRLKARTYEGFAYELTEVWAQADRFVASSEWRLTNGHLLWVSRAEFSSQQESCGVYLDPDTGGIRAIVPYVYGAHHGPRLNFDPPVVPASVEQYEMGVLVDGK